MRDKLAAPFLALIAHRGAAFALLPVLMACGIGTWFALPVEPSLYGYGLAGVLLAGSVGLGLRGPELFRMIAWGAVAFVAGFLLIGARSWMQEAPVLTFHYYGAVEGRVVAIDRSSSDHLRLTLDRVVLERTAPERTPERVRVSLHGDQRFFSPQAGARVMMTAHLSGPMPPSEPGGFDFRRMAWFERLGAVGYTRSPVLALAAPEPSAQMVGRVRGWLSHAVRSRIDGQAGAFAAGAVTGDRSAITQATEDALRNSNLSHLLAISGMNLAFLVGFTFAILRYGLALVPWVALRLNTKKVAAAVSVAVAAFYLALSGGNIATERAFIMAAIMLGAILFDRRALSMRTVALSALILLALRPEALTNAGFQMSMAATVALVWGFGVVDRMTFRQSLPRWTVPVYTAVLSSVIGGLATGPIAAAHFNRMADWGLLANLLTVPAMGTLIMPGAVLASLLGPIGLPQPGLWLMEAGSRWILAVAHWIAGWEGAVTAVPAPPGFVLPGLALGVLWLMIWPQRARWLGALPVVAVLAAWVGDERPLALIDSGGLAVGVMTAEGRVFSHPAGGRFAAESWLRRDGDLATLEAAAVRAAFSDVGEVRLAQLDGFTLAHLKGKGSEAELPAACGIADLVVIDRPVVAAVPQGCRVLDEGVLRRTGAVALYLREGAVHLVPTLGTRRVWDKEEGPRGGGHELHPIPVADRLAIASSDRL